MTEDWLVFLGRLKVVVVSSWCSSMCSLMSSLLSSSCSSWVSGSGLVMKRFDMLGDGPTSKVSDEVLGSILSVTKESQSCCVWIKRE